MTIRNNHTQYHTLASEKTIRHFYCPILSHTVAQSARNGDIHISSAIDLVYCQIYMIVAISSQNRVSYVDILKILGIPVTHLQYRTKFLRFQRISAESYRLQIDIICPGELETSDLF